MDSEPSTDSMVMCDPFGRWIGQTVVLDTCSPIIYIGRLLEVTDAAFLLADADMHDCRDGHSSREAYLAESMTEGVTVNRRSVMVIRSTVISVSLLADVVVD